MNMLLWTTHVTEEHYPTLERLKATGFDGVEMFIAEGDGKHYERLAKELARLELGCSTVTGLDAETNPVSADPSVRDAALDRLKWVIDMSAVLSADILCGPFHSAYATFTGQPPHPDELKRCAEVLAEAAEYAGQSGVTLAVENLNRFETYLLTTVAQASELVRTVDHPSLGLLYDTHHAHFEERNVKAAIEQASRDIRHVHISENDRGTPGTGQVDWQANFQALRRIGYDGWLTIESFSRLNPDFASAIHIWRDLAPSAEEVYEAGLKFIRKMWDGVADQGQKVRKLES